MGYVSYLEDILDRFTSTLDFVDREAPIAGGANAAIVSTQKVHDICKLIQECKDHIAELTKLVEDPNIRLGDEILRLKKEIDHLNSQIKEVKTQLEKAYRSLRKKSEMVESLTKGNQRTLGELAKKRGIIKALNARLGSSPRKRNTSSKSTNRHKGKTK